MPDNLISRDLRHVWHPCSQMKDYASFPPLEVVGAEGSHLILKDGRKIIDALKATAPIWKHEVWDGGAD